LYRVLLGTTNIGDVVLDPFFGTGTTGAVCKMLGRGFIGIEREEFYAKVATKRIKNVRPLDSVSLQVSAGKRGMLRAGEQLMSNNGRFTAKVRADGTLAGDSVVGSIHQVGAKLEGAPSCNGWTYWCFKRDGKRVLIDQLRQQIRDEIVTI
jgi:modification methylase